VAWIYVRIFTLSRRGALALALVASCAGQTNSPWRFWDTVDGFLESYTSSAALTPDGKLWVKHGYSRGVELLDGYTIRGYPDPGSYGRIECAPDGTLWELGSREAPKAGRLSKSMK